MPLDLDFFIKFEIMDRDRCKKAAEEGFPSRRMAPTFEDYKQHQVEQGIITADAIGGKYLPIFLKSYLHVGLLDFDIIEALSKPRDWHGAPMASIRRCIHALGSPRLGMRNPAAYHKLQRLYELYFCNNDNSSPLSNTLSDHPTQSGKKRQYGDSTGEPHSKRHQGPQADSGSSSRETTFCPTLQREVRAYWTLGPDVSAEEAGRSEGARTLSTSGRQMFMVDEFRDTGRPLLSVLADPNSIFIKALAKFRNCSVYANIVNDCSTAFFMTALLTTNPFQDLENMDVNYVNGYAPVVIDPDNYFCLRENESRPYSFLKFTLFLLTEFILKLGFGMSITKSNFILLF
ncbi:hypothetical protein CFD26_100629 [Aspergillus turcosus]|uniref:DUF676 domain-containing protein n=1 Tax=Aspergillus turcosus TaxID=1245748 RepID=A0A421D1Q8_9EURO|nr:hypothetical protein CFD26_100629 [Aspergillus turcosus]